jgi:hypothetical protein
MKNASIREQVERCIEELRRGELTEEGLQGVLDSIDRRREGRGRKRRQDLLYLQTRSTSIDYPVLGMRILENGVLSDGPLDPDEWPYKTVLEAVNDGWRIIKFPEMALLLDESRSFGLACEFILERLREV